MDTLTTEKPAATGTEKRIGPQPGPQEMFLKSTADIAIYGGAAGGGKSYGLLLKPLYQTKSRAYGAVIFRRTFTEIRQEGGLWDTAEEIYRSAGAWGSRHTSEWNFPSGARVKLSHMEHEKNRFDWKGAQIPLICFDELVSFSEKQFFFLMSRNRSSYGFPCYMRATTNPDPDSWVRKFIGWWIDDDTGLAIQSRSGLVRYFWMDNDVRVWGNSVKELQKKYGPECEPRSVTFIKASVHDNKILLKNDPSYLSRLKNMPMVDRMQLLEGNWNVRPAAGLFFKREWFEVVEAAPMGYRTMRIWDLAATPESPGTDPDWTVGTKWTRDNMGIFYVCDMVRLRGRPAEVENAILNTASRDGIQCEIFVPQDPGSAGKSEADRYVRALAGWNVRTAPVLKDKIVRAGPASAQAEHRNIKLVRGSWNDTWLNEHENFPDGAHDDIVDTSSDGVNHIGMAPGVFMAVPQDSRVSQVLRDRRNRRMGG